MLSTIGYESAELADFIETLKISNVQILIDVRERAQSRRKGFSKSALADALANAGIEYLHMRELGDPKEGRDAARSGDFKKFRRIYSKVLSGRNAKLAISKIIEILDQQNVCLLCYERDPMTCHRKMITDNIESIEKIKSKHLGVLKFGASPSKERRVLYTREGAAAQI